VVLNIHEIYQTNFTSRYFKTYFDGILFFSPSAVSSYFTKNTWDNDTHGFCLGPSTAKRLSKFTSNFSKAKKPSENQLMITIQQYYAKK
jgi:uroporphyrinogen-III synthase